MASRVLLLKSLGAFVILNNITTLIVNSRAIPETEESCLSKYKEFPTIFPGFAKDYCNPVFDKYLCWPPTKRSTVVQQNCPKVRLSDPNRYASRRCAENGLWEDRQGTTSMKGWTNFTNCFSKDLQVLMLIGFHDNFFNITKFEFAEICRYIEISGNIISTFAIMVSLYIYYTFHTLRNIRTLIHKHVFYSILFHTVTSLVIYFDQLITRANVKEDETTNLYVKGIDNTPNLCKALYFIAEYSMSTIFSWVLVEGLHLNYLISNQALQQFNFKLYCVIAWVLPFLLTLVWCVVVWLSYRWDNVKLCWFGYNFAQSYWILQAPRLAVVLCNIVILIRILRMVIQKLRDARTPENIKILKSVKAALFLIPILGISNMLATIDISINTPIFAFMVLTLSRQFLKSFQGLILSLIYCLGNEEVRTVVMKKIKTIFVLANFDCFGIINCLLPRRQVNEPLPLSPLGSATPPAVDETTLSLDMRSSSVTQQPPPPYELPLAVISDIEGFHCRQDQQIYVSETSFTDIVLSRHIDSEVEDELFELRID